MKMKMTGLSAGLTAARRFSTNTAPVATMATHLMEEWSKIVRYHEPSKTLEVLENPYLQGTPVHPVELNEFMVLASQALDFRNLVVHARLCGEMAPFIALILRQKHNSLERLKLTGTNGKPSLIGTIVAPLLRHPSTSLQVLGLKGNQLGCEEMHSIGDALQDNRSLKVLTLKDNEIKATGMITLAQILRENYTLSTLLLSGNPISEQQKEMLVEAACSVKRTNPLMIDVLSEDQQSRIHAHVLDCTREAIEHHPDLFKNGLTSLLSHLNFTQEMLHGFLQEQRFVIQVLAEFEKEGVESPGLKEVTDYCYRKCSVEELRTTVLGPESAPLPHETPTQTSRSMKEAQKGMMRGE